MKPTLISALRTPTPAEPLRILTSACLLGTLCGYDGTANGSYPSATQLLKYDTAKLFRFCPEEFSFGVPRDMCDIHGGNGMDVLDGKAKVITENRQDWTAGMIAGAEKMLAVAQQNNVEVCVMMDISAACGSSVIYDGNRFAPNKKYQIGMGVAAALLHRNGFTIISQRDYASLEQLYKKLNPKHQVNPAAFDHQESVWYVSHFKTRA